MSKCPHGCSIPATCPECDPAGWFKKAAAAQKAVAKATKATKAVVADVANNPTLTIDDADDVLGDSYFDEDDEDDLNAGRWTITPSVKNKATGPMYFTFAGFDADGKNHSSGAMSFRVMATKFDSKCKQCRRQMTKGCTAIIACSKVKSEHWDGTTSLGRAATFHCHDCAQMALLEALPPALANLIGVFKFLPREIPATDNAAASA